MHIYIYRDLATALRKGPPEINTTRRTSKNGPLKAPSGPGWVLGCGHLFHPPDTPADTSLGQAFHFGNSCTSLEAPALAAAAWRLPPVQMIQSRFSLHCGQRCSCAQLRLHAFPVHCNCGQYPPHVRRLEVTVGAVVPLTQGSLTCACFSSLSLSMLLLAWFWSADSSMLSHSIVSHAL